ncbi:MAG TPA: 30S ribosomal protein THX [Rhodanobacter sp.]|jgi:30S ribosomal protein S31|nr:30S ribosomal protein THX [Rhodanobacter sp.]
MGKGDRKTTRGKTYRGSYGNTRAHAAAPAVAGGKPTVTKPAAPKTTAARPATTRTAAAKKPAAKKKSA